MPPSLLLLEPYQFSQEQKRIIKDLRGKMLHTGNLVTRVPQVRRERERVCVCVSVREREKAQ